jgi:glucokinase
MKHIAVDFGGTRIKIGVIENFRVVHTDLLDAHSTQGAQQALDRLAAAIRKLGLDDVAGVGLAVPTLVDVRSGRVLMSMKGKYEGLHEIDFPAWSLREFGLPIRVENDAHAAVLGEWKHGAGAGCNDLVMLTLGTGIGTSVIINGRPLRGKHSQAGNLAGHFVIDPSGYPCVCGGRGCVEAQQHLDAVQAIAREDSRFVTSALSKSNPLDYAAIFAHAASDPVARELRDRAIAIWSLLVTSVINLYDCELVIVGGGMMKSADVILPALQTAARRACTPWGTAEVRAASLGDHAGLIGMAVSLDGSFDYL